MYASSSIYSQDTRKLGYTPFEYWKGPKPVSWSYYKTTSAKAPASRQAQSPASSASSRLGSASHSSTAGDTSPVRSDNTRSTAASGKPAVAPTEISISRSKSSSSTATTKSSKSSLSEPRRPKDAFLAAEPLQPDHLHTAQRFFEALRANERQKGKPDMDFANSGTGGGGGGGDRDVSRSGSYSSRRSTGRTGGNFATRPGVMPGYGYDPNLIVSGRTASTRSRGSTRGAPNTQYITQPDPSFSSTSGYYRDGGGSFQLSDVNALHPLPASLEPPPAYSESSTTHFGNRGTTTTTSAVGVRGGSGGSSSFAPNIGAGARNAGPVELDAVDTMAGGFGAAKGGAKKGPAWWNYRTWSRKIWGAIAAAVIAVIVVVIVVAVVETNKAKANRYPDYTVLNYTLVDTYSGTTFFDNFDYFHTYDPASGFVHYVDPDYASTYNLTYATSTSAVVKVDTSVGPSSSPDASTGRFSVRLQSKNQYNNGLFVFDIKHTPYGCATWPALWLTDPNDWPYHGEIDVMEAVNQAVTGNMMTLHTNSGCDMSVKRKMIATAGQADCNNATNSNTGCTTTGANATYGPEFNSAGGGIMAVEWRSAGIRMWQFGRDSIPTDITNKSPDPSSWGTALADFPNTDCDITSHFKNQSIIVNIDLCGDLTNAVWDSSGCSTQTCTTYVANNPSAFTNAYWEFGDFWIYNSTSSS